MTSSAKSSSKRRHFETSPYQDSDCNFASSKNSMSPQHNIHTVIEGTKQLSTLVVSKGDKNFNSNANGENGKNDDDETLKLRL